MYEQFPLLGFETTEEHKNSFFFVFFPDAETVGRIAKLALQLRKIRGLDGKALGAGRFHVSVLNLGEYAELQNSVVDKACEAAAFDLVVRQQNYYRAACRIGTLDSAGICSRVQRVR